jgi:hypothetical protein
MSHVYELLPGDVVENDWIGGPKRACFVAQTEHPVWPSLQLVIWRMDDGRWSHDALDARQEVGEVVQRGGAPLARAALVGKGDWWNQT